MAECGDINFKIEAMTEEDWSVVVAIYAEGIATEHVAFAGRVPESWADFCDGKLMVCAGVARAESGFGGEMGALVEWSTLAAVSDRCVYAGVEEVSVYVAATARGRGVGAALLQGLIARA